MSRLVCIALVIVLCPTVAAAQQTYQEEEPLPTVPSPPPAADDVVTHYYAWTATADAVSASLLIASAIGATRGDRDDFATGAALLVGGLGLAFATPVIHATRGHGMRAIGSYLLRSGFGIVGMGVGFAIAGRCDGILCELDETLPTVMIGTFVGVGVAAVFDSLFLTEERTPRDKPRWTPRVTASHDGASVGVTAAF